MSNISDPQKALIESIINVFETGSKKGDYSNVSYYHDGPDHCLQITYGRSQTTEYSHLPALLNDFITKWKLLHPVELPGWFQVIQQQTPKLTKSDLDAEGLMRALRFAGNDPLMQKCQDSLFENQYWIPAEKWFCVNGFTKPLSMLVIYDSFIHSGGILNFLRNRFVDMPPIKGGDENKWIQHYCEARFDWLNSNSSQLLRNTAKRAATWLKLISANNWSLDQFPLFIDDHTYDNLSDII